MPSLNTLRVFVPFAFGFYLSYVYRSVNAIIAPDLIRDIGIDAANLGLLTGAYFIAFAVFQVPLGIMLDRIEPRRVETVVLIFAALGAFIFATSNTLMGLILGRALIGLGVSACLMASFKAFVDWFSEKDIPIANGAIMTAGGLGALTATAPIELALQFTSWRGLFWIFSGMTVLAAIMIFFVVPKTAIRQPESGDSTLREQICGLWEVVRDPFFMRYVPISVTSQGSMLLIQSLWIGPWLRDVIGLSRAEAANHLFVMAIALAIGFLSWGVIGKIIERFGIGPMAVSISGMIIFSILQLIVIVNPTTYILPILILFSFFGSSGSLSYVGLSRNFSSHLSGRVYTSANLMVFLIAFAGQWGVGLIINLWPTVKEGQFSSIGYQVAFATILSIQLLSFLWIGISRLIYSKT